MGSAQMRTILVIGAGGHARVVVDVAKSAGFEVYGIIDIDFHSQKESIINTPVIGGMNTLKEYDPESIGVAIALGKSELRSEYFMKIQNLKFERNLFSNGKLKLWKYLQKMKIR